MRGLRGYASAPMGRTGLSLFVVLLAACGSRTGTLDDDFDATPGPEPSDEVCNGLDDDLDGSVDEDFRDEIGRYVGDDNCGGCDVRCMPLDPNELSVACALIDETPICAATACAPGFALSSSGDACRRGTTSAFRARRTASAATSSARAAPTSVASRDAP